MRRPMRLMRLATRWHRTQATRIWHHPEFKPFTDQDHDALRELLVCHRLSLMSRRTTYLSCLFPSN